MFPHSVKNACSRARTAISQSRTCPHKTVSPSRQTAAKPCCTNPRYRQEATPDIFLIELRALILVELKNQLICNLPTKSFRISKSKFHRAIISTDLVVGGFHLLLDFLTNLFGTISSESTGYTSTLATQQPSCVPHPLSSNSAPHHFPYPSISTFKDQNIKSCRP
jgi:hypothetical protein